MRLLTLWPDGTYSSQVTKAVSHPIDTIVYSGNNMETLKWIKTPKHADTDPSLLMDVGIVPVFNTYGWMVQWISEEVMRVARYSPVELFGWYGLRVNHVLASNETDIGAIRRVHSHPQALKQCHAKIAALGLKTVEAPSTAFHANTLWIGEAVICSMEAANKACLSVLDSQFSPDDNITTFAALSRRKDVSELDKVRIASSLRGLDHSKAFCIATRTEGRETAITEVFGDFWFRIIHFSPTMIAEKRQTCIIAEKKPGEMRDATWNKVGLRRAIRDVTKGDIRIIS